MTKAPFLISLLVLAGNVLTAQENSRDLLKEFNAIGRSGHPTELLIALGESYVETNPDSAYLFLEMALKRADELDDWKGRARANFNLGRLFYLVQRPEQALQYFAQAINTYRLRNDVKGEGTVALSISRAYYDFDDYVKALEYARQAEELFKSVSDTLQLGRVNILYCDIYHNMGNNDLALDACIKGSHWVEDTGLPEDKINVKNSLGRLYVSLSRYNEAREVFFEALKIAEALNDPRQLTNTYQTIGQLYHREGLLEEAIRFYNNALLINLQRGDRKSMAQSYLDIGKINLELNEVENAIRSFERSLQLAQEVGDREVTARSLMNLGKANFGIGNVNNSIDLMKSALKEAIRINARPILRDVYQSLAVYYDQIGDKENAFLNFNLYMRQNEAIYTTESAKKIAEAQALYQLSQKEAEINLLKKENEIQALVAKERKLVIYGLLIIALLGSIILVILYSRYRLKAKSNRILAAQKDEINKQKDQIESQRAQLKENNKQLTDSIAYARRIQESLLPSNGKLRQIYPESFIFYLPKDIVSGDFYWFEYIRNTFIIATIDCTGHGVPGAFMTVLANSLLNQIVREGKLTDPELIVTLMDTKVREHMNQNDFDPKEFSNDGMDMALCAIDLPSKKVRFTGAQVPIYHAQNGDIRQVNPSKFPVGSSLFEEKKFGAIDFIPEPGDMIYLASDGFQDQFGGPKNRKFLKSKFRELLHNIHNMPVEEQKQTLKCRFEDWKKDNPQTDDVLVIGLRF